MPNWAADTIRPTLTCSRKRKSFANKICKDMDPFSVKVSGSIVLRMDNRQSLGSADDTTKATRMLRKVSAQMRNRDVVFQNKTTSFNTLRWRACILMEIFVRKIAFAKNRIQECCGLVVVTRHAFPPWVAHFFFWEMFDQIWANWCQMWFANTSVHERSVFNAKKRDVWI